MNPDTIPLPRQRNPLYAVLILTLILIVLGAAAWTVMDTSALDFATESVPTDAPPYGLAQIAKPTYTFTPTATLPPPTPTPEIVAEAYIIENTPVPAYVAPSTENDYAQAPSYGGNKYILVDISDQQMYVYEGDVMVYSFVASTGRNNATRTGVFSVLNKIPNAYGSTWNIWMPNWLGIYWAGSLQNGIHALPILPNGATLWSGYLGTPISYGCVVLGTYEAQLLYDWAEIGTPVEIRW